MSRPFSSPLMAELISKVKGFESKSEPATRDWAMQMESQYGPEIVGKPKCIYLPQDEWDETYKHIDLLKSQFGLDVIKSFPKPHYDSHVEAVREFLKTRSIAQTQEARIPTGEMNEQFRWKNYVDSSGSKVSFEDWSAIRLAFRQALSMQPVELSPVQLSPVEQDSHGLSKTDMSEVVVSYEQVEITRGDVATIVAEACPQPVRRNHHRGWLNDTIIHTFLKILAGSMNKNRGYTSIVVANSFVLQLNATKSEASAKRAGIDATTLPRIDMILFPLHSGAHWKLAVAFPKTRSIVLYDSMGTDDQEELMAVRDWLNTSVGEAMGVEWNMKQGNCPRQGDDSLGGVFVCLNAWCVVAGEKPVRVYSPTAGHQLREYSAAVICKGIVVFATDIP